jgi:hypothetical protein
MRPGSVHFLSQGRRIAQRFGQMPSSRVEGRVHCAGRDTWHTRNVGWQVRCWCNRRKDSPVVKTTICILFAAADRSLRVRIFAMSSSELADACVNMHLLDPFDLEQTTRK